MIPYRTLPWCVCIVLFKTKLKLMFTYVGLYGFDTRGPTTFPSMRMNYWSKVLSILRDKVGAEVIVTSVPP